MVLAVLVALVHVLMAVPFPYAQGQNYEIGQPYGGRHSGGLPQFDESPSREQIEREYLGRTYEGVE